MRRAFLFIFFCFFALSYSAFAQKQGELTQPRILILLDESSSMVDMWAANKERYQAADEIILRLMDSIYAVNNQVEFSLRAFGHQHTVQENDCYDTRNEVMFSKDNRTQMSFRLADLHPLGVTPIAYSLKEAAENDLVDEQHYAYSIILITDGGESCGGDICDVVKTLIAKKVYFKPYIVSLVDYAPLKTEYGCLGDYLQVTNERDVPKAVSDIVTAYRPMLTLTQQDYKLIQTVLANPPSILKVNIPSIQVPVQEAKPPVKEEPKPVVKETPPPVVVKPATPEIKKTPPPAPKPVVKKTSPPAPKPVVKETPPPPKPVAPPATHIVVQEIQSLPKDTITRIPVLKVLRIRSLYVIDDEKKLVQVKVPDFPVRKPEPVVAPAPVVTKIVATPPPVAKPVAKITPKPKPVSKPKPGKAAPAIDKIDTKEVTANIATEPAKETSVAVYFRDENGKYYSSTPQVLMIDPHTQETVKKFYRTTDENGTPDPQDIAAGTYNITIAGKSNLLVRNIVVPENQKTKIIIPVTNGSLKFSYEDTPNQPVAEFTALVAERKQYGGKTVKQPCTMELSYEPGNYHIEINTLPPSPRNVDLEFDSETDIRVPNPGYVQFTNQNKVGRVTLYYVLGDEYVRFYSFDATGDLAGQKIQLLPGMYQAHFTNSKVPYAKETVVPFNVRSRQVTETELK